MSVSIETPYGQYKIPTHIQLLVLDGIPIAVVDVNKIIDFEKLYSTGIKIKLFEPIYTNNEIISSWMAVKLKKYRVKKHK